MAKMGISCKVSLLLQGLLQELLVPLLVFLPFCRVSSTLCWMTLFQLQTDRDPLECLNHLDFNLHVQTCSGLCDSVCYFLTNCMDVIIWSSVFFLRPCSIFCLFFFYFSYTTESASSLDKCFPRQQIQKHTQSSDCWLSKKTGAGGLNQLLCMMSGREVGQPRGRQTHL